MFIADIALDSLDWGITPSSQCWNCDGSGEMDGNLWMGSTTTCDVCHGSGENNDSNGEMHKPHHDIVFKCECGYSETESDEYTGCCPMCK